MHEYDITLKLLLESSAAVTMRELTGVVVARWLNVELPRLQNPRVDLLGETAEGELVHIELQSGNDSSMALRMAEYCLGVYRLFHSFPRQILLYVGEAPMRMEARLSGADISFRYKMVDIRSLDGDRLLGSVEVGDNVIAILARLRDEKEAVRRVIGRIAELGSAERETALGQLLILAGLRQIEELVEQEARKMPILNDIMEHKVLGREFKRGRDEGRQEGRQEGELTVVRRLIEKRFGAIPEWAEEQLSRRSTTELEELSVKLLDSASLEELFA